MAQRISQFFAPSMLSPKRLSINPRRRFMCWFLVFVLCWQSVFFPALAASDALGRMSAVIQATQGVPTSDGSGAYDLVTRFQYDEVGHKIWQQDANGRMTRFGYDIRGRMIWRALPMGQVEGMSYDAGGQLLSSTDFRGYVTLLAKVPDSRLREATLTYGYPDENTRIAYRGASATKQSYDPERGWLNSVSGPNGTVSYSYNPEGQKLAMTAPSGTTRYGYDVLGRLSAINDQPTGAAAPTNIATYAYDAVGNLSTLTRGNGVQTRYAYDEQNRLSDLVNTENAGDLSRFHYALREDGKRTGISENIVDAPDATTGAARSSVRSLAYSYDNAGKLTSETGQDGLGVAYQNTWNYDAVGNRVNATVQKAATAGATTWAHTTSVSAFFNANDQLTSQSSVVDGGAAVVQNFSYDANGAEAGTSSASGTSSNGWDFEGKLTGTTLADASGNAAGGSANVFDAAGDRLSHTDSLGKAAQKTTSYLVDTDTSYGQVTEERAPDVSDAAGQPALQARYVWGQDFVPLAMWRKMPDGSVKLFFHLADGQESVRQLTDATGAVADSYFYDAWGNTLDGSSNHVANPFRYTGQQLDADGKYYLRARFYNPGTGRFLSHDPLMGSDGDPASLHRYLYAEGDAVNACDPSGQGIDTLGGQLSTTALFGALVGTFAATYLTVLDQQTGIIRNTVGTLAGGAGSLAGGILDDLGALGNGLADELGEMGERASTSLRESLEAADEALDRISMTVRRLLVRARARARARAIGRVISANMKFMPMPRSILPDIVPHIVTYMVANPASIFLTRVTTAQKDINRAAALRNHPGPAGFLMSWDEYPFASSNQGGALADVVAVPFAQNNIQGGIMQGAYLIQNITPTVSYMVVVLP